MLFLIIFYLDACFPRAIQNNRQWFASPHNRFSTTMKPLCHTDFQNFEECFKLWITVWSAHKFELITHQEDWRKLIPILCGNLNLIRHEVTRPHRSRLSVLASLRLPRENYRRIISSFVWRRTCPNLFKDASRAGKETNNDAVEFPLLYLLLMTDLGLLYCYCCCYYSPYLWARNDKGDEDRWGWMNKQIAP